MPYNRISLDWQLSRSDSPENTSTDWIPATVPGAVQLDWADAHQLPDYSIGDNAKHWAKLEEYFWTYRTTVENWPSLAEQERLYLILEGVDYAFDLLIDGRITHRQEGMHTPVCIDVSGTVNPGTEIRVRIRPAPKSKPQAEKMREQADRSCKPPVAYGWDFHPRLIPLGLWKAAYLEVRPQTHFSARPEIRYKLNESLDQAKGSLQLALSTPAAEPLRIRWTLSRPDGGEALAIAEELPAGEAIVSLPFEVSLTEEQLWWPHDHGQPALHSSRVELLAADGSLLDWDERAVGFRSVRLVMAPGEWDEPARFPKSRSRPPITLEINGRQVFAKGSNWVCPDIFPGRLTRDRYAELLELARSSNFNFLRVWGGATAPHDCFFELCDQLGIMVWQEFPLACNLYPDDEEYLAVLDQESRSLLLRLRGHPSLVLWCGGNELFNTWSKMTDQSLPLRLLNHNCYELDPSRPFLPTAPIDGMGHGHYVFYDAENDEEAWATFQKSNCTAYSEFGCPGPASVESLRRIIPEAELWPPRRGTAWESHHAFGSWLPDSWLHLKELERYFGPCESLEQLVKNGQLLQGIGFQGLFEEARRQKPTASMALNWCFTEPWTCAANNSLVSWPCEPKPALAAVAQACRPTLASARIRKFSWQPGELFDPELWILHDGPEPFESVRVTAVLRHSAASVSLLSWDSGPIGPNSNIRGPRAQFILPDLQDGLFELHLEVENHPSLNSSYKLIKAIPVAKSAVQQPTMNF